MLSPWWRPTRDAGARIPPDARASARLPSLIEVHLRRFPRACFCLKVRLLFESHQARNQHPRKAVASGVVILGSERIVEPRRGQAIFGPCEFVLQLQEALVGFQLRIILSDRKKAPARPE